MRKRFELHFKKLGKNDCWLWESCRTRQGYGQFRVNNKMLRAHRVAYEMYRGKISQGLCVCHSCDNPSCVNPNHLWTGKHQDNMDDKTMKGRGVRPPLVAGEKHGMSKLTENNILEIRQEASSGQSRKALSKKYGVTYSAIGYIIRRDTWRHVV